MNDSEPLADGGGAVIANGSMPGRVLREGSGLCRRKCWRPVWGCSAFDHLHTRAGGATAICGASAALALANHPQKERASLFTRLQGH